MTYGEVYAYRTRKPTAPWGLPLVGRHWAYVGQTRRPDLRHWEHTEGWGRYNRGPSPWSDLEPRRYVLWKAQRCPQWLLNWMEWLLIQVLQPVYNDRHNRANLRRITRLRAIRHRQIREERGWRWIVGPRHVLSVILVFAVVVGLVVT